MPDVTMPQLGESVTEGTITQWFKQVGDQIAEDEVLFEVSTDKVDSEVPSPVGGYLIEIRAAEGDTVEVGDVIAVVGDAPPDGDGGGGGEEAPATSEAEETPPEPEPEPQPEAEPAPAEPAPAAEPESSSGGGVLVSPVVRRLMAEHGIEADQVTGTGVGGRITRGDVEARIERGGGSAPSGAPAPSPAPASAPAPTTRRPIPKPAPRQAGSGDSVEALNNIRRRTGEHMAASKDTSPHAMTAVEVDYEAVERVRRAEGERFEAEEGFSLTYLPFISRAVIDALRDFPHINSSVGDGELVVHNEVNLSIAVDLDYEGLLAPVIHDAEDMRLRAIARSVRDLADRARSHQLSVDDISGGTFTISNSGPFGTFMVIPIINQPQVAILSTDGVTRKPVVVTAADGTEAIAIHSVGMLAMSWDHRALRRRLRSGLPGRGQGDPRDPRLDRRAVGVASAALVSPAGAGT